jgi:hypothetical protein
MIYRLTFRTVVELTFECLWCGVNVIRMSPVSSFYALETLQRGGQVKIDRTCVRFGHLTGKSNLYARNNIHRGICTVQCAYIAFWKFHRSFHLWIFCGIGLGTILHGKNSYFT